MLSRIPGAAVLALALAVSSTTQYQLVFIHSCYELNNLANVVTDIVFVVYEMTSLQPRCDDPAHIHVVQEEWKSSHAELCHTAPHSNST